jgi:hypothetical protein
MVRLKYSAIVKLVALFFFALFIVPSLLKIFNGSSGPLDENGDAKMLGISDNGNNNDYGGVHVEDDVKKAAKKSPGYDRTSWQEVR